MTREIAHISKEITECFFHQYPHKLKEFEWLLRIKCYYPRDVKKLLEVYQDFIDSFDFLIKLIISLEKK